MIVKRFLIYFLRMLLWRKWFLFCILPVDNDFSTNTFARDRVLDRRKMTSENHHIVSCPKDSSFDDLKVQELWFGSGNGVREKSTKQRKKKREKTWSEPVMCLYGDATGKPTSFCIYYVLIINNFFALYLSISFILLQPRVIKLLQN